MITAVAMLRGLMTTISIVGEVTSFLRSHPLGSVRHHDPRLPLLQFAFQEVMTPQIHVKSAHAMRLEWAMMSKMLLPLARRLMVWSAQLVRCTPRLQVSVARSACLKLAQKRGRKTQMSVQQVALSWMIVHSVSLLPRHLATLIQRHPFQLAALDLVVASVTRSG